jgi:hypothetical protein
MTNPDQDGLRGYRVLLLSPSAHEQLLKLTETWFGLHRDVENAPTIAAVTDALLARDALYSAVQKAAR